jgi:tetratricopeptide (TPR) repeat protein
MRGLSFLILVLLLITVLATGTSVFADSAKDCYDKGEKLYTLKKYDKAIIAFDKSIKIDSKDEDSWNQTWYVLNKLGRPEEAQEAYDKAKALGFYG